MPSVRGRARLHTCREHDFARCGSHPCAQDCIVTKRNTDIKEKQDYGY